MNGILQDMLSGKQDYTFGQASGIGNVVPDTLIIKAVGTESGGHGWQNGTDPGFHHEEQRRIKESDIINRSPNKNHAYST